MTRRTSCITGSKTTNIAMVGSARLATIRPPRAFACSDPNELTPNSEAPIREASTTLKIHLSCRRRAIARATRRRRISRGIASTGFPEALRRSRGVMTDAALLHEPTCIRASLFDRQESCSLMLLGSSDRGGTTPEAGSSVVAVFERLPSTLVFVSHKCLSRGIDVHLEEIDEAAFFTEFRNSASIVRPWCSEARCVAPK